MCKRLLWASGAVFKHSHPSTLTLPQTTRQLDCGLRRTKFSNVSMIQRAMCFEEMVPELDGQNHKGAHGKVTVIGGSMMYTGAPYFAAYSAMLVGADYGNVYCSSAAAIPIKCYAPELVVVPALVEGPLPQDVLDDMKRSLEQAVSRSTCVIVGPGLGTAESMKCGARIAIQAAIAKSVPLVIDADGVTVVQESLLEKGGIGGIVHGYKRAVLTPNVPEFWRLCSACGIQHGNIQPHDDSSLVQALADALGGPTLVAKGQVDTICVPGGEPRIVDALGSPRRCGGLGDILAGTMGTLVSWAASFADREVRFFLSMQGTVP